MTITETIARALAGPDPDMLVQAANPLGEPMDYPAWMLCQPEARAAITALTEAGYAIVPVEPTEAMILDGLKAAGLDGEVYHVDDFQALYRALIAPDHIMPPIQEPGPLESGEGE